MEYRSRAADFTGPGLLVLVGAAFAVGSLQYNVSGGQQTIGPGFFPLVAGLLLAFFGLMVGLEVWLSRRRATDSVNEEPLAEPDEEVGVQSPDEERSSRRSVAIVFGLSLVAILLAPVIGFLLSFGLLVFLIVAFLERKGWIYGLALGTGAAAAVWVVFIWLLRIPLPQGIFEQIGG